MARRRAGWRWPGLGAPAAAAVAFLLLVAIVILGLSTADRLVRGRSRADAPAGAVPAKTNARPKAAADSDIARDEILIDVLNGCGEAGAAEVVARALRRGGFDVIDVGNAPGFGYDETIVVDREGKPEVRREVAGYLGCENVVLERRRGSTTAVTVVVGKDYRMLRLDSDDRGE